MPTTTELTDTAISLIALEAETTEQVVRAVLGGDRHVTPAQRGRVVAQLANRGFPIETLPPPAAPLLCSDQARERVTTGRMSLADHGPNTFASRRDR